MEIVPVERYRKYGLTVLTKVAPYLSNLEGDWIGRESLDVFKCNNSQKGRLMCGIAGWWRKNGKELPIATLLLMSKLIEHRGPDDEGFAAIDSSGRESAKFDDAVRDARPGHDIGFASRRLSILDLSEAGHMPMTREHATLIFNGEIYNYVELREELSRLGRSFSSQGDTEVLLQAYLQWGADCLSRLNGMFAFAIWDAKQKWLFCARDHFGIKPFYYYLSDDEFIFASEIRAVLAALEKKPKVNEGLLYDFIAVSRLDHTDETFYEGIRRIPAGHYMILTPGSVSFNSYWKLSDDECSNLTFEEATEQMRELLDDSVKLQMRSDVTVGSCLSGGMDSSVIVSLAAPRAAHGMKCFTARYHDRSMDEWEYAKLVTEKCGVTTISAYAEPECFWGEVPKFLEAQEEPVTSPAVYAHWNLQRIIKENGVTVVLDGQGGDELMCGYAKYFYYSLLELRERRRYGALAAAGARALSNGGMHLLNIRGAKKYVPRIFRHQMRGLLEAGFHQNFADRSVELPERNVRSLQKFDVEKLSLPVLLRYEDKNSMWHSVESRVPFLDYRLASFLVSLPTNFKLQGGQSKRIMRAAFGERLPSGVLHRRSKLGFGGSFVSWVRDLRPQLDSWVCSSELRIDEYIRRDALKSQLAATDPSIFRSFILDRWMTRAGV